MSDSFLVSDKDIRGLAYLKSKRKIANYFGIDIERVLKVLPPRPEKPFVAAPDPIPVKPVDLTEPVEPDEPPQSCPCCGAPVSGLHTVMHIKALVSAYYDIPIQEMTSARRAREVAHPRQVAMYLAYATTPKTLPVIGRLFGGRDHTTVIHAIKTVQRKMLNDPVIDADVCALRERLAA